MTDVALVELVRQAILAGIVVIAPVLVVGFVVGTAAGLVQAARGRDHHDVGLAPAGAAHEALEDVAVVLLVLGAADPIVLHDDGGRSLTLARSLDEVLGIGSGMGEGVARDNDREEHGLGGGEGSQRASRREWQRQAPLCSTLFLT
jgi:hypothetical protein